MRPMAILCAVDFSDTSALALTCAREIADHYAQPLTVVTVADPLLAAAEQLQAGTDSITLVRGALAAFVNERIGGGSAAGQHLQVRIGNPADEVVALARDIHPQLIVVGTQGSTGVEKLVFGSVAERLLRTTDRPVLVVPPAFGASSRHVLGSLREVLVPVDFHDNAFDDARVAARVAHASHATLQLVHVLPGESATRWTVLQPLAAVQMGDYLAGARAERHDKALAALQRLSEALETTPEPHVRVLEGSIAEELARVASHPTVDLVVMGLRGAGGSSSDRVGSVAYRVLCLSPVPVLALPAKSREAHVLGFLG